MIYSSNFMSKFSKLAKFADASNSKKQIKKVFEELISLKF